jgi:hypothetical protein
MSFSRPHIAYIRLSGKLPSKFGKSSYSSVNNQNLFFRGLLLSEKGGFHYRFFIWITLFPLHLMAIFQFCVESFNC